MAITLFGAGAVSHALSLWDGEVWLWNGKDGEVARVNGDAHKVDTRRSIKDARGHDLQIIQTDGHLLLRDKTTGTVTSLDLANLGVSGAVATTTGDETKVALYGNTAVLIDNAKGIVRELDAATLRTRGDALRLPPGVVGGDFDEDGTLWFAAPSEGTAIAVKLGAGGKGLKVKHTVSLAKGGHFLQMTVLDKGAAVMDADANALTVLDGDGSQKHTVTVKAGDKPAMPDRTRGSVIAITDVSGRKVFLVDGDHVSSLKVANSSGRLEPAVVYQGRVYVADTKRGNVFVLDKDGKLLNRLVVGAGAVTFETREGHLMINADASNKAWVVAEDQSISEVDKAPGDVIHGEPTPSNSKSSAPVSSESNNNPNQPPGSQSSDQPNPSQSNSPGQPSLPGSGSSDPGGSQPSGPGPTVGPSSGPIGEPSHSDGPPAPPPTKPPAPRAPDAPTNVVATAGSESAVVSWNPAPDNGSAITKYLVDGGGKELSTNGDGHSLTVTGLTNGQSYQFSVKAVNSVGTGPATQSNSVIPKPTVPDPPTNVAASINGDGSVAVKWQAPNTYGSQLGSYRVTAQPGGQVTNAGTATQVTIPASSLQAGTSYTFTVTAVMTDNTTSKESAPSNAVTPYGKPSAPSSVTAKAGDAGQVVASWGAANANGKDITEYVVKTSTGAKYNAKPSERSHTFTGLNGGDKVTVSVYATNAAGSGPAASSNSVTVPEPPTTGKIDCDTSYCQHGIGAYTKPDQHSTNTATLPDGTKLTATCKASGEEIYAYVYNREKRSKWWIKRSQGDYVPWAWVTLDGGDQAALDRLKTC